MAGTVIITGANGSLGTATVKHLLQQQYRIIAVGHSQGNRIEVNKNQRLEYYKVNLMDEEKTTRFVNDTIKRYEVIDAGLLLVGGFEMGGINVTDGNALKNMFALNFETAYYVARPLFMHMIRAGFGRMVFVGARSAISASQGKDMIAYALSKSLLLKLSNYLNEETKGKNVFSTVIIPNILDTPQNRLSMPTADPKKWVTPEEIALLLEHITGEKNLHVLKPFYEVDKPGKRD